MTAGGIVAPVAAFDVVVLAASSGGVRALSAVASALPESFPAPTLVVQHRATSATDLLPGILAARSHLPVRSAAPGPLRHGLTVLPPGTTADVDRGGLRSLRACPSGRVADELLAGIAAAFGPRALAVVLTGRLSDGAAGVRAVKRAGGRVLVQDPADADAPGMPLAALATGCVEHAVPLRMIATALVTYTMAPGAAELLAVPVPPWAQLRPSRPAPA